MELASDIAREIRSRIKNETGLTASAGISINKFLAKVHRNKQTKWSKIHPKNVDKSLMI